ncbi:MAG: hypothetical protein R2796_12405 [Chitinophagaceae bacterium]|nr:hypothetical protein [Chitinophagaceae bacterium]MCB0742150.1 hypothetical protein [Chitinophagaceae bacterium]HQV06740.1 hypothetical protein [Chitinophagaceae bacterium]
MKRKYILSRNKFIKRVVNYTLFAIALLTISVAIGVLGYHYFGNLGWLDSFYNASMILTGMGPVNEMTTQAAKIFASFYALFSGVVFLSTVAIFFAPFAHRIMHLLHVDNEKIDE